MTYWLVNSGTTEDPWDRGTDVRKRYTDWNRENGNFQMFPSRFGVRRGDVLIHRAVGARPSRLLAVAVVTSDIHRGKNDRWPFQVERTLTHVVHVFDEAPTIDAIGERWVRVAKRISDEAGQRAEELIARAGGTPL